MAIPSTKRPRDAAEQVTVLLEPTTPAIAMSDEKFRRIKRRIERELRTTLTTSLWVAISLALFALGVSLLVAIESATLAAATTAKLEAYEIAAFVGGLAFLGVHFKTDRSAGERTRDFVEELETDLFKVPVPERQGSRHELLSDKLPFQEVPPPPS